MDIFHRIGESIVGKIFAVTAIISALFTPNVSTPPVVEAPAKVFDAGIKLDIFNLEKTVRNIDTRVGMLEDGDSTFGASLAIETPVALFETTLQNGITSAASSMTLSSSLTKDGTTLASSTYSFIIDEGTASEEFVKADCTATACTNMTRGISVITGTSTIASLAKSHRRGASVKITTAPILINLTRIMNGIGTFPNKLSYTTHPTFTSNTDIIDKQYADALAIAGAPDSSATVKGILEKATGAEAAAGNADGTGNTTAPLALTSAIATSTCQIASNSVIVSQLSNGKINGDCVDQTTAYTWTGGHTYNAGGTATTTFNRGVDIDADSDTPLILNGLSYIAPSTRPAYPTVLRDNGSGTLSLSAGLPRYTIATVSDSVASSGGYATTSSVTVPAGVLTASSTVVMTSNITASVSTQTGASCVFALVDSTGERYFQGSFSVSNAGGTDTASGSFSGTIYANNSTSSQISSGQAIKGVGSNGTAMAVGQPSGTDTLDWSTAKTFMLLADATVTGTTCTILDFGITVNP